MIRVAVVGPTATGKSDLALALALTADGEVVNADAMQLYRGMDVGTAKLTVAERRGVPHHQLDVLDVDQEATVAGYQAHARVDLAAIESRGGRPVVAGGSGLYLRALLDRMDLAPTDPQVRARIEAEADELGPGVLHDRLAERDPAGAAAIGRSNTRRLVRALEVLELTGEPPRSRLPVPEPEAPTLLVGLEAPREVLDSRIAQRVDRMWRDGLVEEVAGLAGRMSRTAARAVGYSQVLALLRGETSEAEARAAVVAATRRLSRKQMGWFGRDPRVHWLDVTAPDLVGRALALVLAADRGEAPEPAPLTRWHD